MEPLQEGATPQQAVERFATFYRGNWLPQLVLLLLNTLGQLLALAVLLDSRRPSVGDAFRLAAPLFLPLLLTNLLTNVLIGGGLLLLIIPGLYLLGRLLLAAPALVGERRANPVTAVKRSWELTQGQGWRIFFFAFVIFLVALVVQLAIGSTLGLAFRLLPGGDGFGLRRLAQGMLDSAFTTLFFLLAIALWVALYRRLAVDVGKTFT